MSAEWGHWEHFGAVVEGRWSYPQLLSELEGHAHLTPIQGRHVDASCQCGCRFLELFSAEASFEAG